MAELWLNRRVRVRTTLVSLVALAALAAAASADTPSPARQSLAPAKAPSARSLAAASGGDRRYALANGCYALRSRSAGRYVAKGGPGYRASAGSTGTAEPFRMQATALGSYMLYGRSGDYMAKGTLGNVVQHVTRAGPSADWRVDVAGNAF